MADEFKNVRISVLKHFETQLSGTYSIDWEGVEFDTDGVTEWLEPRLIGPVPQPTRLTERFETWLLNVNCYAKVGAQQESIHRAWELADAVRSDFHQTTIAIQDWGTSGDPTIAQMRFSEATATVVPGVGGIPTTREGLMQVNVSFDGVLIV